MTDNFKIPKEFYVGLQQRGNLTLAFLTPNGTDKAALNVLIQLILGLDGVIAVQ